MAVQSSHFKVLVVSTSTYTVQSVSSVIYNIKDDNPNVAYANGFGHIVDFDYQELLDKGFAYELDNKYNCVFIVNSYLFTKFCEAFGSENAKKVVANAFTRIDWVDALNSEKSSQVLLNFFGASIYYMAHKVDDLKKELNSELVHTDHFTLNLDN
jgi:hypothetical protein